MTLYPKLIEEALATVIYPGTKKNLIESEMLADTPSINGMKVKVVLLFPRDTDPFLKSTVKAAEAAIHYHISKEVEVEIVTEFKSAPRPEVGKMLPQVKNVIAVSSIPPRHKVAVVGLTKKPILRSFTPYFSTGSMRSLPSL